ncbi:alpha-glucuronidase family glycosyl hydrolase [Sphingomonas sp. FW199]|uniref:alpha-glucuronidase family glycosyl hydrolase n=1 Tax=Sphingomonas sp. FW199 TaxID=3400217 RepID=UPI003CE9512C
MLMRLLAGLCALFLTIMPTLSSAEDGHELWLRYRLADQGRIAMLPGTLAVEETDPRILSARDELTRALSVMRGAPIASGATLADGETLVIGTPTGSPRIAALKLPLAGLGDEGFVIRSARIAGRPVTVIAANDGAGVLYGAFRYLDLAIRGAPLTGLNVTDRPALDVRILNHWDNMDRHVERGYAGESIWDWQKLPRFADPRYTDYARANASIGINAAVLNNVNANADILTAPYLEKVATIAAQLRPWNIRVYLSTRFSAPMEIGGLKTADPLDPAVRAWWRAKADEIYRTIPDFGGFLVKANSEGQPGPQNYGRNHVDGANMMADALAPHGGIVMWRAFVYSETDPTDRAKQAYAEFQPYDGKFRDNVLVQVKNGAIDFQPREPFHPLFGAMPKTPLMMEVQLTKEYLGFATHLAYLGPMWAEVLAADTHRPQKGMTVADVLTRRPRPAAVTGMAGVANIGADRNWSGSQFDQANWYAFGRLAWNPRADAAAIARDWAELTWDADAPGTAAIVDMMMASREAVADYMTPLGLTHLMATGHHYGPGPWVDDLARPEWNPVYYHKADQRGIGFDRMTSGSNAIAQYAPGAAAQWRDPARMDERYLLWFHHLPWDHRLKSGETLWQGLLARYDRGLGEVGRMQASWAALADQIDPDRHREVTQFLQIQQDEATWWRDASIAYWSSVSGRPLPPGVKAPPHPLSYYKAIRTPYAPGSGE